MSAPATERRLTALNGPLAIDRVEMRLVRLSLVEPFETSSDRIVSRLIFLVALHSDAGVGWGEVVAGETPAYGYETVGTARHVIREYLGPAILASPIGSLDALAERLARFTGHNMAKAGLELAYVDLLAQQARLPLAALIGGERTQVPVGVSLGIQADVDALLARVERFLSLGYQRIKLKIKPGWDVDVVQAVRAHYPDILLSVDANAAYRLADRRHLARLDEFNLLMIEQPLDRDDLIDHAELQASLSTPICLDESITSAHRARQALATHACRMINIKVGRVGGYSQALAIHDLCHARDVPVWCGGMLESGIGRAHNIALASLPGFTLPGDISASARYFVRDVIDPPVEVAPDGTVALRPGVGLGYDVDLPFIDSHTVRVDYMDPAK
jgi:O-succinylbenzoate synthase